MNTFYTIFVAGLAAHYICYVIVESDIFDPVRAPLLRVPVLREIVTCTNCAAFWAALFVALLYFYAGFWGWFFLLVCAMATFVQIVVTIRNLRVSRT